MDKKNDKIPNRKGDNDNNKISRLDFLRLLGAGAIGMGFQNCLLCNISNRLDYGSLFILSFHLVLFFNKISYIQETE
jgi:hypothetical protein